ncbi:hypothetical protein SERLA73DRAFT_45314 [Serpula lacrymans var. lacrymans S7.3]|uniref:Uncharacterized protein n=1 Tax=Serpula lacrymans var. lacrymans (strain S7.3) TaxID=936435 RepID=F8PH68_SERL3|nr:hypothetical protein SERLA73DRAFT_45314 [Serpula lacrymans var. lacrymans S7.3]
MSKLASIIVELITHTIWAVVEGQVQRPKPRPYNNSILTGYGWVWELINGHSDCIRTELGVWQEVLSKLPDLLKANGYSNSKHVLIFCAHISCNWKGSVTQNRLMCCDFNMKFIYVLSS